MANSPEFERNRRRNRLANRFTNSCNYDELGFGLQEMIDDFLALEDAIKMYEPERILESDI
jgi:hypothetical protein